MTGHHQLSRHMRDCNSRFSGLYLAYKTASSVNIPCVDQLASSAHRTAYHVSALEPKTALHKRDDLVKVTISLVQREQSGQFLSMDLQDISSDAG